MQIAPVIALLYIGPDQMLPIVSTVGGLAGVLMIWWSRIVASVRRMTGRTANVETPTEKQ